jgi:hypothetical protein
MSDDQFDAEFGDDEFGEEDDGYGFKGDLLELLRDLHTSDISFALSCKGIDNVCASIGDEASGPAAKADLPSISSAGKWLCAEACKLYSDSQFAAKYAGPYRSPFELGSAEARAAGCICPGRTGDGLEYFSSRCPEHGRLAIRMIDVQPIRVGKNWRPKPPQAQKPEV